MKRAYRVRMCVVNVRVTALDPVGRVAPNKRHARIDAAIQELTAVREDCSVITAHSQRWMRKIMKVEAEIVTMSY